MEHLQLATRAVHAGQDPEKNSVLAVVPPISVATTYQQPYPAQPVVSKIFFFKFFFCFN